MCILWVALDHRDRALSVRAWSVACICPNGFMTDRDREKLFQRHHSALSCAGCYDAWLIHSLRGPTAWLPCGHTGAAALAAAETVTRVKTAMFQCQSQFHVSHCLVTETETETKGPSAHSAHTHRNPKSHCFTDRENGHPGTPGTVAGAVAEAGRYEFSFMPLLCKETETEIQKLTCLFTAAHAHALLPPHAQQHGSSKLLHWHRVICLRGRR